VLQTAAVDVDLAVGRSTSSQEERNDESHGGDAMTPEMREQENRMRAESVAAAKK
jgi:hypothetical protein